MNVYLKGNKPEARGLDVTFYLILSNYLKVPLRSALWANICTLEEEKMEQIFGKI